MKLKVSQEQYDYYRNSFVSSKHLRRVIREFDLDYHTAKEVLSSISEDIDSVLEVVPDVLNCPVPAHPRDTRKLVFLKEDQYNWLQECLEGFDAHPTTFTSEQRSKIIVEMMDQFFPLGSCARTKELLANLSDGYFLTARSLGVSASSSLDDVTSWILDQVKQGAALEQVVSQFLNSLSDPDPMERFIAYAAVADVLYAEAEDLLKEP